MGLHEIDRLAKLPTAQPDGRTIDRRARGVPANEAGRDCTTKIVDVGLCRGAVIMQRVTNTEHKAFNEGIIVTNAWQELNLFGIPGLNALRDLFNERTAKIEMERQQGSAEPNSEVHAAGYHEQSTCLDKVTAFPLSDTSMDRDRPVEMKDYQLIIDSFVGILEWRLSLQRCIQRRPSPAVTRYQDFRRRPRTGAPICTMRLAHGKSIGSRLHHVLPDVG
jgi:hypothetical protein